VISSTLRGLIAAVMAMTFLAIAGDRPAQAQSGQPVSDIVVQGAERVEQSTIEAYLTFDIGDVVSQGDLDQSLTDLFRTGLFENVELGEQAGIVTIIVVENPIISEIAFEGNREIDDETLAAEVELRPRVVYNRTRVQADVERILDIYRARGYFAATVNPVIIRLDQNRVNLAFEINEGERTGITSITFVGNQAFSDATLREQIATEESSIFDLFGTNLDTFDPDRLSFDEELLRRFYLSEGYADFRVISSVAELTPDRTGFIVTITVEEGELYSFGDVQIVSELPGVEAEPLYSLLEHGPGDTYSNLDVEETLNNLTEEMTRQLQPFADIEPQVTRNREERVINITYLITEGDRVFVQRIDIVGNTRTVDRVIRREILLIEGDPFSQTLLGQSERAIRNLGFFEEVDIEVFQGATPNQVVIQVQVQERSTGSLTIGGGYSTVDGALVDVSLRERNLLGQGQDLRLSGTISGQSSQVDLSFTEPYFLDTNVSAGFDVFNTTREREDTGDFEEETYGFGIRFSWDLAPDLRQTVSYNLERENITASNNDLIPVGDALISSATTILTYDQLDSRIRPREGYLLRGSLTYAGIGGDVDYLRATGSASYYTPIWETEDWILNLSAEAGHIEGLNGQNVRIQDRFFVGGGNLRGFDTGGIGPRRVDTGDAIGGNTYATGTAELSFPVGLPEELGVRGRVFSDVGWLTDVDETGANVIDIDSVRASAGLGISWDSPLGPVRFDFAWPLASEPFDEEEVFRFSFGTSF